MNRKVEEKMAGNRNNDMNVYCSFCGKSQDEVKKLLQVMVFSFVMNVWPYHKKLLRKN